MKYMIISAQYECVYRHVQCFFEIRRDLFAMRRTRNRKIGPNSHRIFLEREYSCLFGRENQIKQIFINLRSEPREGISKDSAVENN